MLANTSVSPALGSGSMVKVTVQAVVYLQMQLVIGGTPLRTMGFIN